MYCQYSFTNVCKTCFHMYVHLSTSNTLLQIFMKTCIIYLYMYCKNNSVDMSSKKLLKNLKCQNSSPIVLIKVSTIVLKEGRSERGYNPETPSNFPYHSKLVLTRWHTHSSYDWWRLPSGEAALASPLWQAPSNSSLNWAGVGVTLGPDSELSVWVLVAQCWGITLGQGSWHLSQRTAHGRVQGEGLCWGWQEAGAWAYEDLGWLRMSPGGKAYVEDDRRLGLRCIDLGWSGVKGRWAKVDVWNSKL